MIDSLVNVRDLAVGYDGRSILKGVSIDLRRGQVLLVVGHNGAGKTTLLRTLFATMPALAGTMLVTGLDVATVDSHRLLHAGVRFLGQGPRSFDELRVATNRRIMQKLYGWSLYEPGAGTLDGKRRVGSLSLGARRLEALNLLRSGRPQLLLLDEPTAGLDVRAAAGVFNWIRQGRSDGLSFIVVEHNFRDLLSVCDHVLVIRNGVVSYAGSPEPLQDDAVLASCFI